MEKSPQLPRSNNPAKMARDFIPVWLVVFWKERILPLLGLAHHHIIIPQTKNHAAWILGAQPGKHTIENLYKAAGKQKKIHLISMLHPEEMVLREQDLISYQNTGILETIDRKPWFDHGTLNVTTGKNQLVESWLTFQATLHHKFATVSDQESNTIFYCHCMAGKSRSLVTTISFIYLYPHQEQLFDFENWPKKIHSKIPVELKNRLRNQPTISEIAEFVKIERPCVNSLLTMDGDQAGFLGLIALAKNVQDLMESNYTRSINAYYREAQDIGLMLIAPLDKAFRDPTDREQQEKNLLLAYAAYQKVGINLLMAMVIPPSERIYSKDSAQIEIFEKYFERLEPSLQARFAILGQTLKNRGCNLTPLNQEPVTYATIALHHANKITAGDQVELLRTFGPIANLTLKN